MTINIDGHQPDPMTILKGSPQGSVLGCLLYCITTQSLLDDVQKDPPSPRVGATKPQVTGNAPPPTSGPTSERVRLAAIPDDGGPIQYFLQNGDSEDKQEFAFGSQMDGSEGKPGVAALPLIEGFKYINDTTLFQAAGMSQAVRHISAGMPLEELRDLAVELAFQNFLLAAEEI